MEYLKLIRSTVVRFWKEKHMTKIMLLLFFTVVLGFLLFFAYMASTANVQSLKDGINQATVIYDKDGDVATTLSTNRTEGVQVDKLPSHVPDAVVAIEDHRFYDHNGFDVIGITRVFFKNLFSGRITGGGSTITQQLTKNALLSPEKTYKRKIEELFLAVEIEKNYSKDDILEMYLNQVYFGKGAWGINHAAKKYFDKDISTVSISEAALLAGLLQAPSALDPFNHYERAMNRRDLVLAKMHETGKITEEEYKLALSEEIILKEGGGSFIERSFPYYVDAALDEAINEYGLTQEEIFTRGYRIYTEMDQNLQFTLEKIYKQDSRFPSGRGNTLVQSGAVLLDPHSGGVRGLVGGRGDYVFRGFNRATHMKAQPGSTLKPITVYTPALESGFNSSSILIDEPKTFNDYTPKNSTNTYRGEVPMYEAVQDSLNLPAVRLLDEIGLEKGLKSLKRFGISYTPEDEHLAIALGGMNRGISPLQLAESYAAFPNGGTRHESHLITKIVGPTGNVIAEHESKSVRVTSKKVANEMTSMLLNVVESGTGKGTSIQGIPIAGKTGSTQVPFEDINGTKDQWFVGYTPNLVGAVWLGYDKTDREHYLRGTSSDSVVPLFRAIFEEAFQYTAPGEFEVVSINKQLAGTENKPPTIDREKMKEKAEQIEQKLKEESSKWKQVLDEAKKDINTVGDKISNFIDKFK
ncbi:PBP1A family penicillin-binding protein [Bacillus sp. PS06]|uniref:PBP1A family penicillin-binding protein n=1 Tax=Bacillus sp. PS06 TaxID=2764176 RepID=UPI001780A94F|nr:PBP1A family penicillin-binding protein [Bacillus sp. PS06]MBD8067690.1 PBP1A family penicillin-binding protein [Bacillus sp. PS06]